MGYSKVANLSIVHVFEIGTWREATNCRKLIRALM